MSANKKELCRHNQTGFCKYRQQCTKEYVNEICNDNYECKEITCKMRHPKKCKTFELFGKCNSENCAYIHVKYETDDKFQVLENVVMELKLELRQIAENGKEENTKKLETLENDVKELKDDVKMLANSIKNTERMMHQLIEKDKDTVKNQTEIEKEFLKCTLCEYKCEKATTLKKHVNTKHGEVYFKCENFMKISRAWTF